MLHTTANRRHPSDAPAWRRHARWLRVTLACWLLAAGGLQTVHAEDGYDLWLRYRPVEAAVAADYRARLVPVVAPATNATQRATRDELVRGLGGLLGKAPAEADTPGP